jgi:hypothetical protein
MFISFVILLLGLDPQCPLEHIDQFRYFNLETLEPYGPQPSYYSLRLTQDVNGINKQTNKQTDYLYLVLTTCGHILYVKPTIRSQLLTQDRIRQLRSYRAGITGQG